MKHTEVFNRWYSERMGHPLGVQLGKNAVEELEEENDKSNACCIDIFNDFSESEAQTMPPSIIGAWSRGKQLLNK